MIAAIGEILSYSLRCRPQGRRLRKRPGADLSAAAGMFCLSFLLPIPSSEAWRDRGVFRARRSRSFPSAIIWHGTRVRILPPGHGDRDVGQVDWRWSCQFVVAGALRSTSVSQGDTSPRASAPLSIRFSAVAAFSPFRWIVRINHSPGGGGRTRYRANIWTSRTFSTRRPAAYRSSRCGARHR